MSGTAARSASSAGDDELADLADLVLAIARHLTAATREVPAVGPAGPDPETMTQTEIILMRFIDRNPDSAPSLLARWTGIRRSNVSTALRSLEAKGLVERAGDSRDGRGARVRSTALAATNIAAIRTHWAAVTRAAFGDDAPDLSGTITLLTRLDEGLTAQRATTT